CAGRPRASASPARQPRSPRAPAPRRGTYEACSFSPLPLPCWRHPIRGCDAKPVERRRHAGPDCAARGASVRLGRAMHDTDFLHEHSELSDADRAEIARYIWSQETVELTTVGIDIGSSTSHLLFAKVVLQRQAQGLSSRFTVIDRRIVWRSPIMLTPFLADGTIDAPRLAHFIHDAYHDAGLKRSEIDSG